MKKDIHVPKAGKVKAAIVQEKNEKGEDIWNAYLLNFENFPLEKVLVTSKGYNGDQKSSTLRHLIEVIPAQSFQKIEPLTEEVFNLNNEYFVTYFSDAGMHELKIVFEAGSIQPPSLQDVPLQGGKGIVRS